MSAAYFANPEPGVPMSQIRDSFFVRARLAVEAEPNSTAEDIAAELGADLGGIEFILNRLTDRGTLHRSGERGAYVYRVPR